MSLSNNHQALGTIKMEQVDDHSGNLPFDDTTQSDVDSYDSGDNSDSISLVKIKMRIYGNVDQRTYRDNASVTKYYHQQYHSHYCDVENDEGFNMSDTHSNSTRNSDYYSSQSSNDSDNNSRHHSQPLRRCSHSGSDNCSSENENQHKMVCTDVHQRRHK